MKITRNILDNAITNLNREAAHEGVGTKYIVIQTGSKYAIAIHSNGRGERAIDSGVCMTVREAYYAALGLLRGRQQQREDRRRAVFGTITVA